ncbi:MAG: SDR family NAD(P)-dependent oxidoreductase [Halioglobus sp.]
MKDKICVVVGVGPGIGAACCRLYCERGYKVAMIARSSDYLDGLAATLQGTTLPLVADVTDEAAVTAAFESIAKEFGHVDTLIYNAARGSFGSFLEVRPKDLSKNFEVNTMGLLYCARAVAPGMIERGEGSILVTGNTAATRGGAKFAAFAPSKSAARSLTQSMARELGPKHVHAAYLVIDGAIDGPFARNLQKDKPDDFFIKPDDIAETIWHLDQQPESCWTSELDLRPFGEKW